MMMMVMMMMIMLPKKINERIDDLINHFNE